MNITLLCLGKTDEKPLLELIQKYETRIPGMWNFQRIEIPDIKNRKNLSESQQKQKEGELFLAKISSSDYVIMLDERGKQMDSLAFSRELDKLSHQSVKQLIFLIGGPYGFSEEVQKRANSKLSLSKMTFTHQMIRLFLVEQIYRAFTILQGKSYHHE